jgi:hypothetical protein
MNCAIMLKKMMFFTTVEKKSNYKCMLQYCRIEEKEATTTMRKCRDVCWRNIYLRTSFLPVGRFELQES